jgi:hypothetical protein
MTIPETQNRTPAKGVGIWLCEGSGLEISPCQFMQSACVAPAPRSLEAKWNRRDSLPPKPFRKKGTIPLLFGETNRGRQAEQPIYLFSLAAPAVRPFERECNLTDWQLPVPIAGIVAIFNRQFEGQMRRSLGDELMQLFRSTPSPEQQTIGWVEAQRLPFVIAAIGYDSDLNTAACFRERFALGSDIPVITGPGLIDERILEEKRRHPEGVGPSAFFQTMLTGGQMIIEEDYSQRVLETLYQRI